MTFARWIAPAAQPGIARTIRNIALGAALLLFFWITLRVDLLIFGGVLLGICLRRAGDGASERTGLPVAAALPLVVLLAVAVFAGITWFFSQAIAGQINELSERLPVAANGVLHTIEQWPLGSTLVHHINSGDLVNSDGGALHSIFGVASNLVEIVVGFFVLMFIGLYLAAEADLYLGGLLRLIPPALRRRGGEILSQIADALWYWMLGRLLSMSVLGGLTVLGLWALGVPVPLALGLLAGLLTFVPYVGAFLSAVPAVLLALSADPRLAIYVVLLYLGIHIVEGYILVPLVQRRTAHLPPALTLTTQVLLGVLAGLLGVLLAAPLLAALLVLVRTIYVEDILGDREAGGDLDVAIPAATTRLPDSPAAPR